MNEFLARVFSKHFYRLTEKQSLTLLSSPPLRSLDSSLSDPKCREFEQKMSQKFATYFIIGGLDTSLGLEADESRSDLTDNNPLERSYKPAILRHLPDASSWANYNPEALSR